MRNCTVHHQAQGSISSAAMSNKQRPPRQPATQTLDPNRLDEVSPYHRDRNQKKRKERALHDGTACAFSE